METGGRPVERSLEKQHLAKQVIRQELEAKGLISYRFLRPTEEEASEEIRSIVVVLFPYYAGVTEGNLSLYCRGIDYHVVVPKILNEIGEKACCMLGEGAAFHAYADTGPLRDRYLVLRSGLGRIGRNQMMISDIWGSYFFVAYLTFNTEIEPDEEVPYVNGVSCLNCGLCVKKCPGGAMQEDGSFVLERCLSGITQKKGILSSWEAEILKKGGMIFGCDVCQNVCPMNAGVPVSPIEAFTKDRIDSLHLKDMAGLTRRTFEEKYPDRAFTWRGPDVVRRNLELLGETLEA